MILPLRNNLLLVVTALLVICTGFENVCLDVNDILSPKWMPGTLLGEVQRKGDNHISNNSIRDLDNGRSLDGTITNALDTMIFHRSMINQYLCRSYVANQILSEMTRNSFKRRMGDLDNETLIDQGAVTPDIMLDQGSSSYGNWLTKSATLADIYRHHQKINKIDDEDDNLDISNAKAEEMDKDSKLSTKLDHDYHELPQMSDYTLYSGAHHVYQPPIYIEHPSSTYHTSNMDKWFKKSDKIADIFEIALTALAYLSFGMFIVHLIMSISALSNHQTTTTSTRIVAIGPAALHADSYESDDIVTESSLESEETEDTFRSIKASVGTTEDDNKNLNEMARKIFRIIESALKAPEDNGQCLRKSLCNATNYSRFLSGKSKLFMGLWSFGASWLSENLSDKTVSKTESLQAILFGLGMANCENIYKKCYA